MANNYTSEQRDLCKEILAKTNFYEILSLPKDCSEEDIKQSYRKLVLILHPDKNSAPEASEAFKKVVRAYDCLKDPSRRERYDLTGTDEESFNLRDCFNEDEFKNLVKDGVFFPKQTGSPSSPASYKLLIHLLPLCALIIISFAFAMNDSSPEFSLFVDHRHTTKMKTTNLGIEYWLKPQLARDLEKDQLDKLEIDVEKHYAENIQKKCKSAIKEKSKIEERIKNTSGDFAKELSKKFRDIDTSPCSKYKEITGIDLLSR